MWIRSQDGKILVDARKVFIKGQGKQGDKFRIVGHGCLGTYSTEDKAKKVLDMVAKTIVTSKKYGMNYIFKMPQEDEV